MFQVNNIFPVKIGVGHVTKIHNWPVLPEETRMQSIELQV